MARPLVPLVFGGVYPPFVLASFSKSIVALELSAMPGGSGEGHSARERGICEVDQGPLVLSRIAECCSGCFGRGEVGGMDDDPPLDDSCSLWVWVG